MPIVKRIELKHSIDINTTPDKIWDFLMKIENNYKAWHPKDHILFEWTGGKPFEKGSKFYAEQNMMNNKVKYGGWIEDIAPKKSITMKFQFPMSIITDKIEMIIEDKKDHATFTHITHLKIKPISRIFFKQRVKNLIDDVNTHVAVESENMKKIVEEKQ